MTGPSLISVASALAAVLGLVAVLTHTVRKAQQGRAGRLGRGPLEVVARAGLGPRQGVAALRVGERLVLVSYGEGGVRHLTDVETPGGEGSPQVTPTTPPGRSCASDAAVAGLRMDPELIEAGDRKRSRPRSWTWMLLAGVLFAVGSADLRAQVATGAAATPVAPGTQINPGQPITLMIGAPDDEPLTVSGTVGAVLFIGVMTLIPTLLLLTTSFTRIMIVLHLLKQALGAQSAPPAHLLTAMSVLLTGFVMAPAFQVVHETAIQPWMAGEMDELQMLSSAAIPMREFMLGATREQDLQAFVEMRNGPLPETIDDVPFVVVTSAFVTSELTTAFQMGFALFLPFVVIDVVVASVLMSMGMFMLPPVMVSLPFKLLLFVLVDGWALIMTGLVQSF